MAKQRLSWVDLAKVISIVLVTAYHTPPPLTGYMAALVQLLRMPAFFLIAGLLFDDCKFPTFLSLLKHRARQLLVPYAGFEMLLIALTCRSWEEIANATTNALLGHPTTCYPLWFLVCLFGMQVIHYLGLRLLKCWHPQPRIRHRLGLLAAYIAIGTALAHCELPQHAQLNAIVINMPFYAAANCCKELVHSISWKHYIATATCLMGGLLLVGMKSEWTECHEGWMADMVYYLMHIAAGLLLLPPYVATCKAIGERIGRVSIIEYLGSNTVVILALHTYFILLLTRVADSSLLNDYAWLNPCIALVIVVAHYPLIWGINRWTPWLLGRGHRTAAQ